MHVKATAKINLNLHISGRRDDGYHLLDSLMVFTDWGDEIDIKPADKLTFTVDGPYENIFDLGLLSTHSDSSNLIIQAVYVMAERAGHAPNLHIHLTKNIPAGAGLGGGSSDAAAIMHALNDLWDMGLSPDDLCQMGLELGAELPACLHGQSVRVRGIGEVIEPVEIPQLYVLIVWPDSSLLTKDVFDVYRQNYEEPGTATQIRGQSKNSLDCFVTNATRNDAFINMLSETTNDLTDAAMSLCPEISNIIQKLKSVKGCQLARMSGSGSACFGIFECEDQADIASKNFKNAIVTKINS